MLKYAIVLLLAVQAVPTVTAQQPSFEVLSVRPVKGPQRSTGFQGDRPGRLTIKAATIPFMIVWAYSVREFQILGGPDWINEDRFDIEGIAGQPLTHRQMLPLLQQALTDRFHLEVHREEREMPVYALVVDRADGKLGPKLHKSAIECGTELPADHPLRDRICSADFIPRGGMSAMVGTSVPVGVLSARFTAELDRPVINRTNLTGSYDFDLAWSANPSPDAPGASLFTALKEQLGLRLDPTRAPFEVIVIDHVEHPTPN